MVKHILIRKILRKRLLFFDLWNFMSTYHESLLNRLLPPECYKKNRQLKKILLISLQA